MRVQFIHGTIPPSDMLRERAVHRIRTALGRFGSAVRSVELRIGDDKPSHPVIGRRCRIVAHLVGHEPVVVEHRHSDFYAAIDHASDRLRNAVGRRLRR